MIYDVLQTFGELTEEAVHNRKYAKWKAAYIHNCLKNGETPIPGPMQDESNEEGFDETNETNETNDAAAENQDTADPDSSESNLPPTAEEILNNPSKLPSPPVEEEKPGGFEPFVPPAVPHPVYTIPEPVANLVITADQMLTAQKYCKYASSALNYDDVKTAIENLQKALTLLTTGQDN